MRKSRELTSKLAQSSYNRHKMTNRTGHFDREFDLSGGVLCLDFANTVSKRKTPGKAREDLAEFSDFVMFAKQSQMISSQFARELLATGLVRPGKAARVLRAAIVLREATYRAFSAIAALRPANSRDVKLIDDFAGEAMKHRRLVGTRRSYRWEWKRDREELLSYLLWPIAQSAADLLTSPKLGAVRECGAGDCAWLFLDESRNHSRRWCDMKVCGNRQKARRHYQRVQR
jgi:predicted RNA-binding Zn ribbon-like protein